jgi:prepilin signal peptidase PulO-like enzyme (type II secretory pathway)
MGLSGLVLAGRLMGGEMWESLFGSLLGMAFAGGAVWAVRIVAGYALQQEAMGFGDVTLMAMIGTFVGWQASLLVFGLAPFAALLIAGGQYLFTNNRELAFGPYLSLAAVCLLVGWHWIWHDWARDGLFLNNQLLIVVLIVSLALFGFMLVGVRGLRRLSGEG